MNRVTVLAYTSKNPAKQAGFRKMVEESDVLRNRVELFIASSDEEALTAQAETTADLKEIAGKLGAGLSSFSRDDGTGFEITLPGRKAG